MKYFIKGFVNGTVYIIGTIVQALYCFLVHSFYCWSLETSQTLYGPYTSYNCDKCKLEWFTKYDDMRNV